MKAVKQKFKVLRQFFHYGEIKHYAQQCNIEPSRAWEIARGRISPRANEMTFAHTLINVAAPRIEEFKRLEKITGAYEGDKAPTMGMSY